MWVGACVLHSVVLCICMHVSMNIITILTFNKLTPGTL